MSKEDQEALIAALARMVVKGGKDMDLAIYAIEELRDNRWDMQCCCPAVKCVVNMAFNN
jgi:hypothetical protein